MVSNLTTFTTLATLALTALDIPAQEVSASDLQPRNDAGFMHIKRSFNATQLTVFPGIDCNDEEKACALTSAIWHKGRFWVLGREGWCCALSAAVAAKTFIHEWTGDGTYIKTVEIPIPSEPTDESDRGSEAANTAPEVRDMSTDEWRYDALGGVWVPTNGQAVFIGSEEGIYVTRVDGSGNWSLWDQIETANGTRTVGGGHFANPIAGPGLDALKALGHGVPNAEGEGYMGVAFDPTGNGGEGSFWVGADDGTTGDGLLPPGDPRGFNDPLDAPDAQGNQRYQYGADVGIGDTLTFDRTRVRFDANGNAYALPGGNVKPILEIDLQGNILRTLHNGTLITDPNHPIYTHWDPDGSGTVEPDEFLSTGGEWTAGGLELDPLTGNLWVQANMDQQIFEVDTVTGDATGFVQNPFRLRPGRVGGVTIIPNGDPGSSSSFMDLVAFTNVAGDDFFSVHRGHQYPGFNGLTEPRLLTTTNPKAGPQTLTPIRRDDALAYTRFDNIDLLIDENGQGSSAGSKRSDAGLFPAVMMFDINAATDTDAETDFTAFGFPGVLPELKVHSFLSAPDLNNPALPGGVAPYFLSFTMPTDVVTPFAAPNVVPTGQKIRMQAIYFDSRSQYSALGAMVTNEAWMAGVGQNQILVELVGNNSFTSNPDGFFRFHYMGGPGIEVVKLDFAATTTNFDILNANFDMDDGPLVGYFGVGRGWDPNANGGLGGLLDLPGCDSTFRQDSDITTGLVYATEYNYPAPFDPLNNPVQQFQMTSFLGGSPVCDYYTDELGFEFRSGVTGTDNGNPDSLTDIVFQFTDFDDAGDVLRFDADTDNTVPNSADGHLGMVVTVVFAGGQSETGELLLDPQGGRTFIGW